MARVTHKSQHEHHTVTCGACGGRFPMCGLPCFIFCPLCQALIKFREE